MAHRLRLRDICFRYGQRPLLEHFDLDLAPGEILRIDGSNGSGKTTLFHLIMGLLQPEAGSILFSGRDITGWSVPARARLGLRRLHQSNRLFGMETAATNVAAAALIQGPAGSGSIWRFDPPPGMADAVKAVGTAGELSYGWQKAVSFMQVLAPLPAVVLLDEPYAGLSPPLRHWMAEVINRCADFHGSSVLLVDHEHNRETAARRTVFLTAGGLGDRP